MFDLNSTFAALAVAVVALATVTLVLSRIIPDEYDRRRVPVRTRAGTQRPLRER